MKRILYNNDIHRQLTFCAFYKKSSFNNNLELYETKMSVNILYRTLFCRATVEKCNNEQLKHFIVLFIIWRYIKKMNINLKTTERPCNVLT